MDSVLRPRDIQARIRSGESPESVAAAAQTSVDKIMGFATPVLAERAYVAEQALKASVRRRAGDGPVGHLGEAVERRLATRSVDVEAVEWDAWRREDGRWTLVAAYPGGSGVSATTHARFVYDVAGRYVVAEDDEARWLVGERTATPAPGEPATTGAPAADRAPAVAPAPADPAGEPETASAPHAESDPAPEPEQLPLGDDAIGLVTGVRPAPEPPRDDDWMVTQASDRAARRTPPAEVAEPATLFDAPEPVHPPAEPEQPPLEPEQPAAQGEPDVPQPREEAAPPDKPRKARSKRASVPSWDEIMFGSGKGE